MQYNTLITDIQADIYSNGYELITGDILQSVLIQMVNAWASAGAVYGGVITPASAAPADLDQATVYLALEAGTYTNFVDSNNDPIVTTGPALITFDGGATLVFSKTDLPAGSGGATPVSFDSDTNLVVVPGNQDERSTINLLISYAYDDGNDTSYHLSILSFATSALDNPAPIRQILRNDMTEVGAWLVGVISGTGEVFCTPTDLNAGDVRIYVYDMDGYQLELRNDEDADYPTSTDFDDAINSVDDLICNSVKFTSQSLTDAQKLQARTNIGAAGTQRGILSQTQTWSGTGSQPRTYVMSDKVWGAIPQANIDLFEAAGATFNAVTGYFEINGLTDISYEEMEKIYNNTIGGVSIPATNRTNLYYQARCRTNIPITPITGLDKSITRLASRCELEVLAYNTLFAYELCSQSSVEIVANSYRVRKIIGAALRLGNNTGVNNNFNNAYSLEEVNITNLQANISFGQSPNFTLASVVYMVKNAANTGAITITLHATAYARCQADTTEYTYNGQTYTGILALATAHNITIASA